MAAHSIAVRPSAERDWYIVVGDALSALAMLNGSPGIRFLESYKIGGGAADLVSGQVLMLHRTHLPVLGGVRGGPSPYRDGDHVRDHVYDAWSATRGFSLRDHQHSGRVFIRSRAGTLLADQMRVGKGQRASARILTPSGWSTIGQLKVGDAVIDPNGGAGTVLAVYPRGVQPIYRLTTCDGASTECDDDHLWLLETPWTRWAGTPARVVALKDFRDHLWQRTPSRSWGRGNRKWFLPLTCPVEFAPGAALPLDPWLLGVIIGNGNGSIAQAQGSPSVSTREPEIYNRVVDLVTAMGLRVRRRDDGNGVDWYIAGDAGKHNNSLTSTLRDLGLWGCRAEAKFIPERYLRASIEDRLELLQGLMDTDGDVTDDCATSYNTVSPRLREDILELIRSLGGFASVVFYPTPSYTYKGETRVGQPSWRLHIRMPVSPFTLSRKAARWEPGYMARGIESVERVGEEATFCIRVSTKRQLYITDDYIVTHNTLSALAAHDPNEGRLVVCAPLPVRHVWLKWMRLMWPERKLVAVTGRAWDLDEVLDADLVFCHYDILGTWQSVAPRLHPATLIFDEAHVLSSRKTDRAQAAALMSVFAGRVICATGTPLWNKPAGFWGPLSVACPAAFGKYFDFAVRYASGRKGAYGFETGGASHTSEMAERLSEVHLARTWKDLAADLPPTYRKIVTVPVNRMALDIEVEVASQGSEDRTFVGQMTRYRAAVAGSKVMPAVDLVETLTEPVVVWVWHKAVAKAVVAELARRCPRRPVEVVHGDHPSGKREARIAAWDATTDGVLVITMAVGQAGIDLSHAKSAVFAELDWTPAVLAQTEMRTFSPLRSMHIYFIVADHEVDLKLAETIQAKCEIAREMGVAASEGAADLLGSMFPGTDAGDLDRLMAAVLS